MMINTKWIGLAMLLLLINCNVVGELPQEATQTLGRQLISDDLWPQHDKYDIIVRNGNDVLKNNENGLIPAYRGDLLTIKIDKPEKGGKWKYEPCMELGEITSSPTTIKLIRVGECIISYVNIQGKRLASVTFLASNKKGLNEG
jgi:hypothetical protein